MDAIAPRGVALDQHAKQMYINLIMLCLSNRKHGMQMYSTIMLCLSNYQHGKHQRAPSACQTTTTQQCALASLIAQHATMHTLQIIASVQQSHGAPRTGTHTHTHTI
jgi:hypothetical protein